MTDLPIERLIAASSLGTPEAVAARAGVSDETARRIVERATRGLATEVMHCPVEGCRWDHVRTDPNQFGHLIQLAPDRRGFDVSAAMAAATQADDDACRAHLDTHPVEDFVRTINDLRNQLDGQADTTKSLT
ncbi:hypothetical protein [Micromonospora sp. CA-248212]|uniref:hypothetical protein n=1 Tax=Micromonospora sp. CA-248212 TaxID=3239961 RepID=UPI003D8B48FA